MLKIAIECGYNTNFKSKDIYGARYYMQKIFKDNDIELVRVSINKYNKRKKYFNEYCIFNKNKETKTIKKPYTPDIIRNRKSNCTAYKYTTLDSFTVIPSQHIATIANDKYETYMLLQKYQPKTFLLSTILKNKDIQKKYTGAMILKPIRANGGNGIEKVTIQELIEGKEKYIGLEDLYIVQEFKDFSQGYPGIVAGNHDIRLMFAGKNIIEITLRIPKEGGFKSNIGSGGSQINIQKDKIPKDLLKLAKKIYKEISVDQKEIFSIDFAFCQTEKRRYVLEINASPGTRYYQTNRKKLREICEGFINFFKKV